MKKNIKKIYLQQKKRYLKKIIGSLEKPRLSVFRSHKHIYAQLIDDKSGKTLGSSSTLETTIKSNFKSTSTKEASFSVGESIAEKALSTGIKTIIFDRGDRPYHGRIEQVAEGARSKGLFF
jgi:large subunit ribosomal protein L18